MSTNKLKKIKLNIALIEAMNYYWISTSEKEKVSEKYLNDLSQMDEFKYIYDDEFNAESVRKVLSAITNREPFSSKVKKESRFWNNNMWMLEDLDLTNLMVQTVKMLNLDDLVIKINEKYNSKFEEIEIIFIPEHFNTFMMIDNKLIINFFKIIMDFEGNAKIENLNIKDYIESKIIELCKEQ